MNPANTVKVIWFLVIISTFLYFFMNMQSLNLLLLLLSGVLMSVLVYLSFPGKELPILLALLCLIGGLFVSISFVILFSSNSEEGINWPPLFLMLAGALFVFSWEKGSIDFGKPVTTVSEVCFGKFSLCFLFILFVLLLCLPLLDEMIENKGGSSFS